MSVTRDPSISIRIPVSIGSVSSLPAATTTCDTASENASTWAEPVTSGMVGSCG